MISQLKQRQVFKVATIYAVSAWPLIQIADLAVPALGLPDSVMTLLLQIFIAGFPISLAFAWLFNFTNHGIVRAKYDDDSESKPQANIKATIAIVSTLIIILLVTLGSQLMLEQQTTESSDVNTSIPATPSGTNETVSPQKNSIAILPFVPFSDDPQDEFFADGMVEELLNLLAKIPDLKVAARTSSFAFKGVSNKTISEIGQELGVETILEGSIRKNDVTNKIRVTAQLIKVATGEHIWSETYDREYRDIFQIQDDIARAVVEKMESTLLGNENKTPFVAETTNVDAMVEFGKGQQQLQHRTLTSLQNALTHFTRATELDSQYARAFVGIADTNVLLAMYGNLPMQTAFNHADKAINQALTLNPELAAAYASKGLLLSGRDPQLAEQSFKKAIELNPNYAMSYMWYGSLMQKRGQQKNAHQLFIQALELDPKSPVAAFNVAWGFYLDGREDKAMELFSQIIANDPYYPGAYNLVANILSSRGRLDQASNMYQRALEVDPLNLSAINGLLISSMDMGYIEETQKWFDYLKRYPNLMSESDISRLKARFFISQGDVENARYHLQLVSYDNKPESFRNYLEGEKAFYNKDYALSVSHFEKIKDFYGENVGAFYYMNEGAVAIHLAYAYKQTGKAQLANELVSQFEIFLDQEMNTKSNNPDYYYNKSLVKSLQGNTNEALYYLQGAIDAGWVKTWQAKFEPALASLQNNLAYQQMLGGVSARLATMRTKATKDEFLLAENEEF